MQRKVILYLAVSLDGFIADKDGGVDWIAGQESGFTGDYGYQEFYDTVDTILIGYKTYHQIAEELFPDTWYYAGKESYIFTHHELENRPEITFTSESPARLIEMLKARDGKHIWLCGGADLVRQFAEHDLIDEYHLTVMPVLLGDGIRLFDPIDRGQLLKLTDVHEINGALDCVYVRR